MLDSPALLAFAGAVLLLAGFVKGVIGLGLPLISVGLLAAVMPPLEAAALLVIPNLLTNGWQIVRGPPVAPLLRRLWPTLAAIVAGTLASAPFVAAAGGGATLLLGAALIVYAALGLASVRFVARSSDEPWLGPLVGASTGFVTMTTGVFVVPVVPYLQALGLEKDELVQALGLSFFTSSIALGVALAMTGRFGGATGLGSVLALAPALAGMAAGQLVRDRLSQTTFRRCFLAGLLLLGVYLVARSLG
jgi:uncharacterized membrane protein YfcA